MAVVETTADAAGRCRLRTSVSTTGVFIIGTLREHLHQDIPGRVSWDEVVHWSSHHPAFSRVAEELDDLGVSEALSLNVPEHVPELLALCARYAEEQLLPAFRLNHIPELPEILS